jgi:hypothetical protein
MKFSSVESLILQCELHLDAVNARSTHIESYFVHYILVRMCAEFESRIAIIVQRRCARSTDQHLREFAQRTAKYVCKRFDIKDIGNILERFGPDYKKSFHDSTVLNSSLHVSWNNIYANRHAVAHGAPPAMSLTDLKTEYQASLKVLDALVSALSLTPGEISDLT